jgi:hypothetical protein
MALKDDTAAGDVVCGAALDNGALVEVVTGVAVDRVGAAVDGVCVDGAAVEFEGAGVPPAVGAAVVGVDVVDPVGGETAGGRVTENVVFTAAQLDEPVAVNGSVLSS